MNNDLINGLFEIGGAALICLSIRRIWIDRAVRGFSPWPIVFFTAWGFWNAFFYYPGLDQWFSWAGGVAVVTVNSIYLALIWLFTRKPSKERKTCCTHQFFNS